MTLTTHAKLINGKIKYATNPLWIGDTMIANPKEEVILGQGYKKLVYDEMPSLNENEFVEKSYEEVGNEIRVHFAVKEYERPEEPEPRR